MRLGVLTIDCQWPRDACGERRTPASARHQGPNNPKRCWSHTSWEVKSFTWPARVPRLKADPSPSSLALLVSSLQGARCHAPFSIHHHKEQNGPARSQTKGKRAKTAGGHLKSILSPLPFLLRCLLFSWGQDYHKFSINTIFFGLNCNLVLGFPGGSDGK